MNNLPFPPSRATLMTNARLMAADWRASGALARYFIASQFAAMVLMALCAAGSIAAIVADDMGAYLGLLGCSAACFVHTFLTTDVLKRRFFVRYEIW